jgi:thioredoxin 1
MKNMFQILVFACVAGALLTGSFPGSDSRCSCGGHASFAQTTGGDAAPAQEPEIAADPSPVDDSGAAAPTEPTAAAPAPAKPVPAGPLPKMVDLGAHACKACKTMAPILEQAEKDYAGIAEIVFIDVWKDRTAGPQYGIRMIPTQIFFDASGKEVWRHEGVLLRDAIDKKFAEMGVKVPGASDGAGEVGNQPAKDGES